MARLSEYKMISIPEELHARVKQTAEQLSVERGYYVSMTQVVIEALQKGLEEL